MQYIFDVHMPVHRKYISNVQPTRCNVFSIYFYKLLYMFQAVPPPIIRSTKLYIQCLFMFFLMPYCCICFVQFAFDVSVSIYFFCLMLYVQFCGPDDGWWNCLKHVEQFIEINRSRKCCILLVVLRDTQYIYICVVLSGSHHILT